MSARGILGPLTALVVATVLLAGSMGYIASQTPGALGWIFVAAGLGIVAVGSARAIAQAFDQAEADGAHSLTIVQHAADAIITADRQGNIEFMNAAATAMFGYEVADLRGCSISTLLTSAYAEEEDADVWDFLRMNALRADGLAQEVVGLRRSTQKFFMDLSMSETEVAGEPKIIAVIRDVTARKEAELALRRAHDELEERVAERTADLQASNCLLEEEMENRAHIEEKRQKLIAQLQDALAEIKILGGLIPICASCKKVRDDTGYWNQIETYVRERSDAEFSHSVCPECVEILYPEIAGKL